MSSSRGKGLHAQAQFGIDLIGWGSIFRAQATPRLASNRKPVSVRICVPVIRGAVIMGSFCASAGLTSGEVAFKFHQVLAPSTSSVVPVMDHFQRKLHGIATSSA